MSLHLFACPRNTRWSVLCVGNSEGRDHTHSERPPTRPGADLPLGEAGRAANKYVCGGNKAGHGPGRGPSRTSSRTAAPVTRPPSSHEEGGERLQVPGGRHGPQVPGAHEPGAAWKEMGPGGCRGPTWGFPRPGSFLRLL